MRYSNRFHLQVCEPVFSIHLYGHTSNHVECNVARNFICACAIPREASKVLFLLCISGCVFSLPRCQEESHLSTQGDQSESEEPPNVSGACTKTCTQCEKTEEGNEEKLKESLKRKEDRLSRADLERELKEKDTQLESRDRCIRRLERMVKESSEEMSAELQNIGTGERKDRLIRELNDKKVRLSRTVEWFEFKPGENQKQLERMETEKVRKEEMRHEIRELELKKRDTK